MKNKFTEPELLVDDHHGIYMGKFAYEFLKERYKKQIEKHLSPDELFDLLNPESEFYFDACNKLQDITFTTETGQKFYLQYAEGGIWLIPACFMRTKKYDEFIGH